MFTAESDPFSLSYIVVKESEPATSGRSNFFRLLDRFDSCQPVLSLDSSFYSPLFQGVEARAGAGDISFSKLPPITGPLFSLRSTIIWRSSATYPTLRILSLAGGNSFIVHRRPVFAWQFINGHAHHSPRGIFFLFSFCFLHSFRPTFFPSCTPKNGFIIELYRKGGLDKLIRKGLRNSYRLSHQSSRNGSFFFF